MAKDYHIFFPKRNCHITDMGMAHILNDNIGCSFNNVTEMIKRQIKWLITNCTNLNSLNMECAIENHWYHWIGIYNNNILQEIKTQIDILVVNEFITQW